MPTAYPFATQPIRLGRPDVSPSAPAHVRGVREGNEPGGYDHMPGHHSDGRSDARRSTGVAAADRDPILPGMPNLQPA
jgi:hypothetical protein